MGLTIRNSYGCIFILTYIFIIFILTFSLNEPLLMDRSLFFFRPRER